MLAFFLIFCHLMTLNNLDKKFFLKLAYKHLIFCTKKLYDHVLFFEAYLKKNPSFLILIKDVRMKSMIITKKYAVDSAIQFLAKSILRPMVFAKTTR